jgi:four helix bundle protein
MSTIQTFKDIKAWEKSIELVKQIYLASGKGLFSKDNRLQEQIRKAVVSISSNIAEGFEREGNKEFIQFLSIAKGSAAEVQTQVRISFEVGYISIEEFRQLDTLCIEVISLIAGFMKYLRSSGIEGQKFKRS